MKTDRELLELAAKAAQIKIHPAGLGMSELFVLNNMGLSEKWNPLTDDGDALRLAVKLDIQILTDGACIVARTSVPHKHGVVVSIGADKLSATRRAITMVAAEIQLAKERA